MAFYNTCSKCGASLDPGERCDCESEQEKRSEFFARRMRIDHETGQYSLILDKKELSHVTKFAN